MSSNYPKSKLPILLSLILLGIIFIFGTCSTIIFLYFVSNLEHQTTTRTLPSPVPTQTLTITTRPSPSLTPSPIRITDSIPSKIETPTLGISTTLIPSSTAAAFVQDTWCVPWNTKSNTAQVFRVIDGTSIEVVIEGDLYRVKYLGIEIPDEELHPDAWIRAKQENEKLVSGQQVLLIKDRSETDEDNRLLRYVISGVTFVNYSLVNSGFALANSQPPDISCDIAFAQAELQAIGTGQGIWEPTLTPSRSIPTPTETPARTGNIIISFISSNGAGWQQPDEFVEIKNNGDKPVQIEEWILRDSQNHVFRFPPYVISPGQYCRIYTNQYNPGTCGFSFGNPSGIWADDFECAYLYDRDGNPVDTFCYE